MLIGVGVSCRISDSVVSYLYVSFRGLITSVRVERAFFLLSFTCKCVVSVGRGFLLVLGTGYVILLSRSLGIPYNYYDDIGFT